LVILKSGVNPVVKMQMGGENGRIFGRNFEKGKVNEGF